MVLVHLESLVLRGVSVLGDGPAVSLRLGSYETKPQTDKATPISQRHPSHGCATAMPETSWQPFPNANAFGNGAALWAGRLSRAGVLSRRSPAFNAGRTNVHRWSDAVGGPQFTAAARLRPEWAKQPAPVGDVFSGRPSTLDDQRGRQGSPAGIPGTATRTLTAASTRGRGF
jgi:hypothetical protein